MTDVRHDPSRDRITRMLALDQDPSAAWARIGGFGALADWHPMVTAVDVVEVDGQTCRHVTLGDGSVLYERLIEAGAHHLSYALVDSPLPVSDHRATLSCVAEPGGGCHVYWSAVFAPADGADAQVDAFFTVFFEQGLAALRR